MKITSFFYTSLLLVYFSFLNNFFAQRNEEEKFVAEFLNQMKLNEKIEPVLTALGYKLVDFEDKHLCCGSAGTYSITQKQLSTKLRSNKLEAICANQPDMIITANIGCQTHLQNGTDIPVKHWLELLV